jgi:hypothetical protein
VCQKFDGKVAVSQSHFVQIACSTPSRFSVIESYSSFTPSTQSVKGVVHSLFTEASNMICCDVRHILFLPFECQISSLCLYCVGKRVILGNSKLYKIYRFKAWWAINCPCFRDPDWLTTSQLCEGHRCLDGYLHRWGSETERNGYFFQIFKYYLP